MADTDRNYADECGDHGGSNSSGNPCGRPAGWGTPNDSGRCRHHLGTSPDGSSHEGNQNAIGNDGGNPEADQAAITHGAYTEQKKLYNKEFSEREVDLTDRIFEDYIERYTDTHGSEAPTGFELRLFNVAVNAVTEMRVENWYTEKPDDLDTGTPHIDREAHVSENGQRYYRYKKSPALPAMKHLSDYNHRWLKNFDLLPDAESKRAEVVGDLASIILNEST